MFLKFKDLLGIEHLNKSDLQNILDSVKLYKDLFKKSGKVDSLRGKTVVTLFYEPSTRTRTSFEIAAKKLSADVVNITVGNSSVAKGESLVDTGRALEAMGANYIVIRHMLSGAPDILAKKLNISVINAGDGFHEHPTQGLLDLYTIYEKKKKIEGLKVLIVGDILHSRVAKSNIWALTKMGAEVLVSGPSTLIPIGIESLGVKVYFDLNDAIKKADVLNILRMQFERQQESLFPSIREYINFYQLTLKRLSIANPEILIMHPGPMNRGIEITSDVADIPDIAINEQIVNGIAVRMAILCLLGNMKR